MYEYLLLGVCRRGTVTSRSTQFRDWTHHRVGFGRGLLQAVHDNFWVGSVMLFCRKFSGTHRGFFFIEFSGVGTCIDHWGSDRPRPLHVIVFLLSTILCSRPSHTYTEMIKTATT
jgi:hypothetical protein